jgi:hypothetical protein
MSQKRILGYIKVEIKFVSKAKQRKDRNIVHSPDVGWDTSDSRYKECSHVRGIYGGKVV